MNSKEELRKLINNILDNGKLITVNPEMALNIIISSNSILMLENVVKDLDQLELIKCLEKTLGIDLFILFGALKNGIYYKSFDGDIDYLSNRVLTLSYNLGFDIWVEGHRKFDGLLIDFKDYGKTWALEKEELQDDK